jgi:hypothetical protein
MILPSQRTNILQGNGSSVAILTQYPTSSCHLVHTVEIREDSINSQCVIPKHGELQFPSLFQALLSAIYSIFLISINFSLDGNDKNTGGLRCYESEMLFSDLIFATFLTE